MATAGTDGCVRLWHAETESSAHAAEGAGEGAGEGGGGNGGGSVRGASSVPAPRLVRSFALTARGPQAPAQLEKGTAAAAAAASGEGERAAASSEGGGNATHALTCLAVSSTGAAAGSVAAGDWVSQSHLLVAGDASGRVHFLSFALASAF
jgi:hypothetical protein